MNSKIFVIGGAGFVGSHLVDALLYISPQFSSSYDIKHVTIYDNFSYGRKWHYEHHLNDDRLRVVEGDIEDFAKLESAMAGHDVVVHLAANPDIFRSEKDPTVDYDLGIALTNNVLEAMRKNGIQRLLFASSGAVYGDLGQKDVDETYGPLFPISTYGASKVASETLIYSYCYMFGLSACAFRFANVVGDRQTHGIAFDFIRKLLKNPKELPILGDGTQSKPYVAVTELVDAILLANAKLNSSYEAYNIGTPSHLTVKEIAELTVKCMELEGVEFRYAGGNRGWKGDVPVVRLNTDKICALGWKRSMTSYDAIKSAIGLMLPKIKSGKIN